MYTCGILNIVALRLPVLQEQIKIAVLYCVLIKQKNKDGEFQGLFIFFIVTVQKYTNIYA